MKIPVSAYLKQLKLLKNDLNTLMDNWPSGPRFNIVKKHAEAIAPLIAVQIQQLKNAESVDTADPVKLCCELIRLRGQMLGNEEIRKFTEYIDMLDSLIKEGVA